MTQKTAMQQLIEWCISNAFNVTGHYGVKYVAIDYEEMKNELTELLATEKQQITSAHDSGYNEGLLETGIHGEQYYEQTFGNSHSPSK